ncbi:DUF1566 domain-containing protein [uncultured Polaribacter sp.]|uniref:DUF1566 domain-containing protein n=1 Tax=uncultured Polaribacter sp. TaxID=174711 RepID=UPI0026255A8B|nr:DUF1566 domain-containing protein [uncultured Polaribacter sp.]
MKYSISILFIFLGTFLTFSQSPEKMNYQAVIRNASNELIKNKTVGVKISILKNSVSGTIVFEETYNPSPSTNANGLLTLEIGTGTANVGDFTTLNWGDGEYFIKSEIDPEGGSNYTITATSQLMSVPYALHAKTAGNIKTYKIGDFAHGGIVFWLDESRQHGLVCAKTDANDGRVVMWDPSEKPERSLSWRNGIYGGKINTSVIMSRVEFTNVDSEVTAAQACSFYGLFNGSIYSDWYVPSKDELNLLYINKDIVDSTAISNNGMKLSLRYWSSTEFGEELAWAQDFVEPTNQFKKQKNTSTFVRPIRSF